jgi:hypothetical protein
MHTGYWVAIWAEAGPNMPNPHMASNVRRMMRIAHLRFQSDGQMVGAHLLPLQGVFYSHRAVALSASTTSGASGTLMMTSNPL